MWTRRIPGKFTSCLISKIWKKVSSCEVYDQCVKMYMISLFLSMFILEWVDYFFYRSDTLVSSSCRSIQTWVFARYSEDAIEKFTLRYMYKFTKLWSLFVKEVLIIKFHCLWMLSFIFLYVHVLYSCFLKFLFYYSYFILSLFLLLLSTHMSMHMKRRSWLPYVWQPF